MHAAMPDLGNDPIVTAAHTIAALQACPVAKLPAVLCLKMHALDKEQSKVHAITCIRLLRPAYCSAAYTPSYNPDLHDCHLGWL